MFVADPAGGWFLTRTPRISSQCTRMETSSCLFWNMDQVMIDGPFVILSNRAQNSSMFDTSNITSPTVNSCCFCFFIQMVTSWPSVPTTTISTSMLCQKMGGSTVEWGNARWAPVFIFDPHLWLVYFWFLPAALNLVPPGLCLRASPLYALVSLWPWRSCKVISDIRLSPADCMLCGDAVKVELDLFWALSPLPF